MLFIYLFVVMHPYIHYICQPNTLLTHFAASPAGACCHYHCHFCLSHSLPFPFNYFPHFTLLYFQYFHPFSKCVSTNISKSPITCFDHLLLHQSNRPSNPIVVLVVLQFSCCLHYTFAF